MCRGVAGSAPTVLAAAVAGRDLADPRRHGRVMLPNHRTMVVAEQFGVLESLFPGRIDMGLGRSVGFTDGIRRALGAEKGAMDGFAERLAELGEWFAGGASAYPQVHARPAEGLRVPVFILANDAGADIAAEAGAALVIGGLHGTDATVAAIERYRKGFRASAARPEPYVVLAGNVAVAATAEEAARLLVPEAWAMAYSRTRGVFPPLAPAEEVAALAMTDREREHYGAALRGHVHGTEDEVAAELAALVERTGADELLVTTNSYDREALLDSYARLARLAGLPAAP
ncbi:LLM class flavin-dependent oxidoreductase [Streptomyces thioluteus]|uniref:LLM class flavin-dependent oxidoreductase n=1 Tax=Streptomyces thioluteus TaxID=66431 RepID=A0ABN3WKK4_STRTU